MIRTLTRIASSIQLTRTSVRKTEIYPKHLHLVQSRFYLCKSMEGSTGIKIEGPHFTGIFTEPFKELVSIFERHGYELRINGGAVRDLLNGEAPHDVDLSTTATPHQMREIFTKENIRMFNEQGEKHGTVTVRLQEKENFEITTLRIDKVTDGRHAEVEFTLDWKIDAERRDLTVNSMYLGLDGTLFDFFGGKKDLENRRVAFVGDARSRIQEDYLRILRYFRFFGRLAKDNSQHEEETLAAISENVAGMSRISGERIWSEWKKILSGNLGGPLTLKMVEIGLGPYIGLPEKPNVERMDTAYRELTERQIVVHPVTLLTTLLENDKEMMELHQRLKFSGIERDLGLFVINNRGKLSDLKRCKNQLVDSKAKPQDCKVWIEEVLKYENNLALLEEFSKWEPPKFPVGGNDLKEAGCPQGKMFSAILQKMKETWKESDFTLGKEELMVDLPKILDDLETQKPTSPKRAKMDKRNRVEKV